MDAAPALDICHCAAIRKAARHVTQLYDRHLSGTGLRVTQFGILARLDGKGPRTINELATDMVMDRTTMGRTVKPLERDGLVTASTDPRDGRRRPLALTDEGRRRVRAGRESWRQAQAAFEETYGSGPALALRETLAGLAALSFADPS